MKRLIALSAFFACTILFAQPDTEVYTFNIETEDGKIKLTNPRNISNNQGYDNQPSFYDNNTVLFASTRDGQTDILKFNIQDGSTTSWITDTPTGSEYSPLRIPESEAISAIRLDLNGLQRLYEYDITNGTSKVLLKNEKIGYHVWYTSDMLVATVLKGDRMDLVTHYIADTWPKTEQKNVGRSLQKIPNSKLVSYVSKENNDNWELKSLNPITGATKRIISLGKIEDVCWLPNGTLIAGRGKNLLKFNPKTDKDWSLLQKFTDKNINNITRLAVNKDASRLAFVAETSPENIVQEQLDAYNARNIEAFLGTYTPDVEVYDFPNTLRYKGIQEMRKRYAGFFDTTPDLNCEIKNRIVIGNKVIDEEYITANKNNFGAVAIYEVKNGKIAKVTFVR
ncbi:nuclear transport factor 2 family protein [Costertonia aggregata]|uniref:Nuclear transport factor 2 family protein n=1 Tax=Costertonia aggregata TaxID=343403 RepID=A0A7H9AKF7_9FLAO|nr:nuclear transport factor 2 family protein [Costertonia aggregata]QLG43966.1 nuclear transport factor 2 family protein [Costertonia aggregata]